MFQLGIQIIPVGLHLSKKEVFRSESAAWVGTPVTIDADVAETHGHDTRAAARALTDRIAEAMRTVTVNLNAWEDLELLELAGQIWTDEHDPVIRLQTMADAERTFVERRDSATQGLRRRLLALGRDLKRLGIDIADLELEWRWLPALGFTIRNLGALILGAPIALCGALAYLIPYHPVRVVTYLSNPLRTSWLSRCRIDVAIHSLARRIGLPVFRFVAGNGLR